MCTCSTLLVSGSRLQSLVHRCTGRAVVPSRCTVPDTGKPWLSYRELKWPSFARFRNFSEASMDSNTWYSTWMPQGSIVPLPIHIPSPVSSVTSGSTFDSMTQGSSNPFSGGWPYTAYTEDLRSRGPCLKFPDARDTFGSTLYCPSAETK